jgi:putative flippase GtrA
LSPGPVREAWRLYRLMVAGSINSLVGYAVIFGGMALGLSPYASNLLGYSFGFACSFLLQKKFVFGSTGAGGEELRRFLVAFPASYSANLAALHALLHFGVDGRIAQAAAALPYLLVMYLLSRFWVFRL